MRVLFVVTALVLAAQPIAAQSATVSGNIAALVDHLRNVPAPGAAAGSDPATELRLRALVDALIDAKPWLRFRLAGVADGLVADRGGRVTAAAVDALEAWVEFSGEASDFRAGVGRLAWGRLDEVQPTDVINPIDVSRYLLEGRAEARIAVPFLRGRVFSADVFTLEAVLVPMFRRSVFDRLDEETSPFNLLADASPSDLPPQICGSVFAPPCPERFVARRNEPTGVQGGARASITTGRVDWSISAWRGFLPFGVVANLDASGPLFDHPRYTMVGADLESVAGKWAWRAEAAFFPNRPTEAEFPLGVFNSHAFEGGAGVDRRAGDFTLSATVLVRRDHVKYRVPPFPRPRESYQIVEEPTTNVSVVAGFSRTFNRDRLETRAFSLVNPADRAAFLRGVLSWKPADDVAVESSVGWFIGDGDDAITRFSDRDFASVRLKYYFGR